MHYEIHYQQLISNNLNTKSTAQTERHHIVPVSLGGTDEESNIVYLDIRSHFLAHLLLFKMGNLNQIFAVHAMLQGSLNPKYPKRYKKLRTKRWIRKAIAFGFARASRDKSAAEHYHRYKQSYIG